MASDVPSLTSWSQLKFTPEAPSDTATPQISARGRPKLSLLETCMDKPNFYCTMCKCHLKLRLDFQAHLRGKRHLENKALKEKGEPTKPAGTSVEMRPEIKFTEDNTPIDMLLVALPMDNPEDLKLFCVPCRLALDNELNKRCHIATPTHLERTEKLENLRKRAKEDEELCKTCFKLIATSDMTYHLDTEDHIKNAMYRLAPCEICSVKYGDLDSLRAHMKTKRHQEGLDEINRIGTDHAKLLEYFTKNANSATVKRQAFCLLCTTILGNLQNLELHNILNEERHVRQKSRASNCGPNKFWCYVCLQAVDDVERRIHAKRDFHKKNKFKMSKYVCEECNLDRFESENSLSFHLNSEVHKKNQTRREFLTKYYENKYKQDFVDDQAKALAKLLELKPILAKVPADEDPLVEAAIEAQNSDEESDLMDTGDAPTRKPVSAIFPVVGDYCQVCDKFSPLDVKYAELCSHIRLARGYEIPKKKSVPKNPPQSKKRPAEQPAPENKKKPKTVDEPPNDSWASQINQMQAMMAEGKLCNIEIAVEAEEGREDLEGQKQADESAENEHEEREERTDEGQGEQIKEESCGETPDVAEQGQLLEEEGQLLKEEAQLLDEEERGQLPDVKDQVNQREPPKEQDQREPPKEDQREPPKEKKDQGESTQGRRKSRRVAKRGR